MARRYNAGQRLRSIARDLGTTERAVSKQIQIARSHGLVGYRYDAGQAVHP
jgi:DNA-binding transcriptional regulator LsrR (DeoR family)